MKYMQVALFGMQNVDLRSTHRLIHIISRIAYYVSRPSHSKYLETRDLEIMNVEIFQRCDFNQDFQNNFY